MNGENLTQEMNLIQQIKQHCMGAAAAVFTKFGTVNLQALLMFTRLLLDQYEQTGNLNDLNIAVAIAARAVGACPPGDLDLPVALDLLGYLLCTSYGRLAEIADLEVAIQCREEALDATPPGHRTSAVIYISDSYT